MAHPEWLEISLLHGHGVGLGQGLATASELFIFGWGQR